MKTVPTLCAAATIVGVSSVGYALGRPEQPQLDRPATSKRKHSSELLDRSMPSQLVAGLPNTPYDNKTSPKPADSRPRSNARRSVERRNSIRRGRVALEGPNASTQVHKDEDSTKIVGKSSLDLGPRLTVRSRPSWMKRLSTMSSLDSNSSASPRPESPIAAASPPAPTSSNASPATLQRRSMLALTDPSSRPPPNKLVKRSSSQRFGSEYRLNPQDPPIKRPITSYGRSYQLRRSASKTGSPFSEPSPVLVEKRIEETKTKSSPSNIIQMSRNAREGSGRWRQFFSVKISNPGAVPKRAARESRSMKRIIPEEGCLPTLITAKSILTSSMDVDERYEPDDESIFFPSRPGSAYLDALPFDSINDKPLPVQQPTPANLDQQTPAERAPRRSFSLHELLSLGPSSQKSTPTPPRNIGRRLSRKAARRVFSEPLAALGIGRASMDVERPSKRRDITDPSIFQRASSSHNTSNNRRPGQPSAVGNGIPSSPFTFSSETRSQNSRSENRSPSIPQQSAFLGAMRQDGRSYSPIFTQSNMRPSEHSAAPSERASTLVGSDTEMRGNNTIEEDETDYGGETLFDSIRTRTTRSASGARDHRIETIFDESPPARKSGIVLTQNSVTPTKPAADVDAFGREQEDIMEEDEGLATPVRTIRSDRADDGSPIARMHLRSRSRSPLPSRLSIPSSPPELSKSLNLGTLEYDDELPEEDEESRWSCLDEDEELGDGTANDDWAVERVATPMAMTRPSPLLVAAGSPTSPHMPDFAIGIGKDSKRDTITSLFEWSEHPPEKSPGNRSPPRPRTVHGKKDTHDRGSRPVGRRAPSALHVRSQSVPVVPNASDNREVVVTNKFGTWGVGSKGVSEDWDDDFDFGEASANSASTNKDDRDSRRIDSGIAMRIPQTIRERQVNVVNNISLVREFGLHVEELKTVRARAMSLGLFDEDGSLHNILDEIDGVIELADQDTEEFSVAPRLTPPSSPSFDSSAFNDIADGPSAFEARGRARRCVSADISETKATPLNTRNRRKTLLSSDTGVLSSPDSRASTNVPANTFTGTRPRKDSEAIARSVIEALKKGKSGKENYLKLQPVPSNQRIHFDTTTLSRIVPLVNGLVRQVKQQIREVEKLDLSPASSPVPPASQTDLPLTHIFRNPGRPRATSTPRLSGEGFRPIDEMAEQMKVMTVM